MESDKKNTFLAQNTIFGLLVGISFILVSFIYFKSGRSISVNPQLNNVITLLLIAGTFIGGRKYRQESLGGYMSYGTALGTCMYIIAVSSLTYSIYIYVLYSNTPELLESYIATLENALRELYANSPMLDSMLTMITSFTTAAAVAFAEFFNKLFLGFIFSLLLAGILKRNIPTQL